MTSDEQPPQQEPSLYRRHRPRTFADVVGQEPVVRTLRNAVEQGKVHHAYLFVGSRGTGKTSMAKILAACLNCEEKPTHPTIEPCGSCESCLSIATATSLDVIEMDAASNNSVDDIRELRESVAFAPVSGRRKVYILDEAHMLTTAAWNAFLKTLEEPPPGTVFVLATTEAAKVPATVVDRCHRFDFHRPTVEQIALVLRRAAEAESISIPPPALAALARSATGSFRDALGTLEQIVTYGGSEIAVEDVLAVLGVADAGLLARVLDAVSCGDGAGALRALAESVEQGRDAASFARDLEVRCRELLVVQTLDEVPAELSLTPEADEALSAQAESVSHAVVVRLLELLGEAMEAIRAGAEARTRLELALVKAARPEVDSSVRALLARIERLEAGGAPRASAPAAASRAQPASAAAVPSATASPVQPATPPDGAGPAVAAAPATDVDPAGAPAPATADAIPSPDPQPGSEEASQVPHSLEQAPAQPTPAEVRDLESLLALWPAVVELVRAEHSMLGAVIAPARPVALDGETAVLAFGNDAQFYKRKAEEPANRAIIAQALCALAGGRWQLAFELRELKGGEAEGPGEPSEEVRVARFMQEFDAEEIPGDWDEDEGGPATGALTSNEKGA